MEKSSRVHHLPRSRTMPRTERERGAPAHPRRAPDRAGRLPEASSLRQDRLQKKKPDMKEAKMDQQTGVKLKPTVVDIDSVRDDEAKEENMGLLEAAEQEDGESKAWRKTLVTLVMA